MQTAIRITAEQEAEGDGVIAPNRGNERERGTVQREILAGIRAKG
jgi:hypothetical protein